MEGRAALESPAIQILQQPLDLGHEAWGDGGMDEGGREGGKEGGRVSYIGVTGTARQVDGKSALHLFPFPFPLPLLPPALRTSLLLVLLLGAHGVQLPPVLGLGPKQVL